MSGSIIDLSRLQDPENLVCEICIIGSGSGGATAARVLAEAGFHVLVLEEGGDFTAANFPARDAVGYDQLYMDRGGRMTVDFSINVLQGRVLGGGGVINASDVVSIPDGVLDYWNRKYALSELTPKNLEPYRQLALEDLFANPIQEEQLNAPNRLLRQGAEHLGLKGHIMTHNRVGCAGLGKCLTGCPLDAKKSPRMVSIPKALEAGATFYVRARAIRIENGQSEIKTVRVRALDARGYHEQKEFRIQAPVVIVAANAVATPQILLRSGLGNEHVGQHLSLQPQLPILAYFDDTLNGFLGIPQAYAVTEFEEENNSDHGLWGFRIESIMGTPGIVGSMVPFFGEKAKQVMLQYPKSAASLLLAPDDPTGSITLTESPRPKIQYEQQEDHKKRLKRAALEAAKIYLSAGAKQVVIPTLPPVIIESQRDLSRIEDLKFDPVTAPLISAHQQCTARFGHSEKTGAVDPDGKLYGTKNIYVFDSSVFPSSASSHTMAPVISMARYLSARLVTNLRK